MPSDEPERPPLLVWRAGVYWDAVTGTDRQLVTQLSRWVDVLWVDPPRSVTSVPSEATLTPRRSQVADGVTRLTVTAPPFALRPGVAVLSELMLRSAIRSTVRRDGRGVAAVVGTTPFSSLTPVAAPVRAYYATDDFVAGADLLARQGARIRRAEQARLAEASIAGAVSQEVVARWSGRTGPTTFVLANGCDTHHYRDVDSTEPPIRLPAGTPVAGLVGQLSSRIDLALLEAVAATDLHLLMVGPRVDGWGGARFDALASRPNVTYVGAQPYASLPSYLALMDVGLTPYADTAFNQASSPLKTLEYLAAGRPVVSTPLSAVAGLDPDCVRVADTPESFATTTRELARAGSSRLRGVCRVEAERHSWHHRASELLDELGLPRAPAVRPAAR